MADKEASREELVAALELAKKAICPYCAHVPPDPISLDTDGVDRSGRYHAFYGGNEACKAGFIQDVLPSPRGKPIRSLVGMRLVTPNPAPA